jgi:hypothetical protein
MVDGIGCFPMCSVVRCSSCFGILALGYRPIPCCTAAEVLGPVRFGSVPLKAPRRGFEGGRSSGSDQREVVCGSAPEVPSELAASGLWAPAAGTRFLEGTVASGARMSVGSV